MKSLTAKIMKKIQPEMVLLLITMYITTLQILKRTLHMIASVLPESIQTAVQTSKSAITILINVIWESKFPVNGKVEHLIA